MLTNTLICVAGPTASGKTELAIRLAQTLGGEVVGADSMQIYRGMAIGTAAPTEEERARVRHHMVGVSEPGENWSAARYVAAATPIVDRLLAAEKTPIVCGGTFLWMEALVRGLTFAPGKSGGAVRAQLEEERRARGMAPLLEELRRVDPESFAHLHPNDEKRILRALEVWRESGETISAHNAKTAALPPRYRSICFALSFQDRDDLKALIDLRVERMVAAGLLPELDALLARGIPRSSTALQAIGYKELLAAKDGLMTMDEAIETVKLRSRQYAKRQLTWLRRRKDIHWILWDKTRDFDRALSECLDIIGRESQKGGIRT